MSLLPSHKPSRSSKMEYLVFWPAKQQACKVNKPFIIALHSQPFQSCGYRIRIYSRSTRPWMWRRYHHSNSSDQRNGVCPRMIRNRHLPKAPIDLVLTKSARHEEKRCHHGQVDTTVHQCTGESSCRDGALMRAGIDKYPICQTRVCLHPLQIPTLS